MGSVKVKTLKNDHDVWKILKCLQECLGMFHGVLKFVLNEIQSNGTKYEIKCAFRVETSGYDPPRTTQKISIWPVDGVVGPALATFQKGYKNPLSFANDTCVVQGRRLSYGA